GAQRSSFDLCTEYHAHEQEPRCGHRTEYGGGGEPTDHQRRARNRRGDQPVDEPDLDIERKRNSGAHAGEHRRLHHRSRELEVEKAVYRRKAREVHGTSGSPSVDREEERGEEKDGSKELWPAKCLPDRAPAEGADVASETASSRCGRPTWAFNAPGVPSAAISPASMIPTRSASWSASSRYWVVRKTVVPSTLSFRTSSQIARRLIGSSPVVGSSRNRTRGSWTRADARSSLRLMPPEYVPTFRSAA